MIDKENFQKTFEKLHASPDTLTEVLKMAEEEKVIPIKRKRMPRIAVAVLALILVMSMGGVAYAKDFLGIQRTVQIWLHGDLTNATLTVDNGSYLLDYTDENGNLIHQSGGGFVINEDGVERPLTMEEFLDDINNYPDVIYDKDGKVWIFYKNQKWDITDKFEDEFCYVTLILEGETKYITVMYNNGYAVDSHRYSDPEDFPSH